MATCPFAAQRPIPSHGGARSGHYGVVYHVTTNHTDPWGFFDSPRNQASSTFWVGTGPDELEQYMDTDMESWAQESGNAYYGSIEVDGTVDEPMNPAQIATLGRLIAWWRTAEGDSWPLAAAGHGGRGITTHCHYPSGAPDPAWGDHPCPGTLRLSQMAAVVAAAVAAVAADAPPSPPPPPPPEEDTLQAVKFAWTNPKTGTGALYISDGFRYQWMSTATEVNDRANVLATVSGKPVVAWSGGAPVGDIRAFGRPDDAETAAMAGVAFP